MRYLLSWIQRDPVMAFMVFVVGYGAALAIWRKPLSDFLGDFYWYSYGFIILVFCSIKWWGKPIEWTSRLFRALAIPTPGLRRRWALALGAHLVLFNDDSPNSLINALSPRTCRTILSEWWGVDSREDALDKLAWLHDGGHETSFQARRPEAKSSSSEERERRRRVDTIVAWDIGRLINVARWSYTSGYLSRRESWEWIETAGDHAQATFDSWKEFGDSYELGSRFWHLGQGLEFDGGRDCAWLSHSPQSLWNRIPWGANRG